MKLHAMCESVLFKMLETTSEKLRTIHENFSDLLWRNSLQKKNLLVMSMYNGAVRSIVWKHLCVFWSANRSLPKGLFEVIHQLTRGSVTPFSSTKGHQSAVSHFYRLSSWKTVFLQISTSTISPYMVKSLGGIRIILVLIDLHILLDTPVVITFRDSLMTLM